VPEECFQLVLEVGEGVEIVEVSDHPRVSSDRARLASPLDQLPHILAHRKDIDVGRWRTFLERLQRDADAVR
jgi:hypothetical protein